MTIQQALGLLRTRKPIAVQHIGIHKRLQFQIARQSAQPVRVGGQVFDGQGSTKNRQGHDCHNSKGLAVFVDKGIDRQGADIGQSGL